VSHKTVLHTLPIDIRMIYASFPITIYVLRDGVSRSELGHRIVLFIHWSNFTDEHDHWCM